MYKLRYSMLWRVGAEPQEFIPTLEFKTVDEAISLHNKGGPQGSVVLLAEVVEVTYTVAHTLKDIRD